MAQQSEKVPVKSSGQVSHPLMNLRDEVDRMFDNFMTTNWPSWGNRFEFGPFKQWSQSAFALTPVVDVSEVDAGYEISVELPGLESKDIELTLNNNLLTIKGEKKEEHEEKKKDYYVSERSYGAFQRSFTLPDDIDADKIDTGFSKGVLTIKLPKSAEAKAKTRKIEVKTAA